MALYRRMCLTSHNGVAVATFDEVRVAIAARMEEIGVSKRELARRLAGKGGAVDDTQWETQRRWITKLLRGELRWPTQAKLDSVAVALELPPGTYKAPRRAAVVRISQPDEERLDRIEAKIDRMAYLIEKIQERSYLEDPEGSPTHVPRLQERP